MNFRVLDLFCGAGGMSHGMHQNKKFSTMVALDFNERFAQTFILNNPNTEVVIGDIQSPNIQKQVISSAKDKKINMVIGGPPCQGFSTKGKNMGLLDPRNFLFLEFLNLVDEIRPSVFVIENVKNILTNSNGWFKQQIIEKITDMGYSVEYGIMRAIDFGVPQTRERAIFICSLDVRIPLPSPISSSTVTVRDAISDLSYLESGEGEFEQDYLLSPQSDYQITMRKGAEKLYNHKPSNHSALAIKKLKIIPPEKGKEFLPKELIGKQKHKSTWGRLKWDKPSPTIDTRFDAASNGTNNHPYLHRSITPREAARLQSFDDQYIFYGKKVDIRSQIGNAVPPLMAKAIADQIERIYG